MNLIDRSVPEGLEVHVIVDNSSTHKTPAIHRWFVRHPRFTFHFTPTYSSWLNLVERWFAELTQRWLRRGSHRSTKELVASIRTWIDGWNEDPKPFVWHKSADEILEGLAPIASGSMTQDTRTKARVHPRGSRPARHVGLPFESGVSLLVRQLPSPPPSPRLLPRR